MEREYKVVFNRHLKQFFFSFCWGKDISLLPANPNNINDQWLWDGWDAEKDLEIMLFQGYKWVSKPGK